MYYRNNIGYENFQIGLFTFDLDQYSDQSIVLCVNYVFIWLGKKLNTLVPKIYLFIY